MSYLRSLRHCVLRFPGTRQRHHCAEHAAGSRSAHARGNGAARGAGVYDATTRLHRGALLQRVPRRRVYVLRIQGTYTAQQLQRDQVYLLLRLHDPRHLARLPAQLLHDDAGLLPGTVGAAFYANHT